MKGIVPLMKGIVALMKGKTLVLISAGAVAAVLGLGLVLSGAFSTPVPADGSSCAQVAGSHDSPETAPEITAWVESKQAFLTREVSADEVAEQVDFLCLGAWLSSLPQDFTIDLLGTAEGLAWEKYGPTELTDEAKEWLRERTPGDAFVDPDKDEPISPEEQLNRP